MRSRPGRPAAARRRSVRLRFTALYAVLFLLSGAGLLGIVYVLASGTSVVNSAPAPNQPAQSSPTGALADAHARIAQLQGQLDQAHATQSRQLLVGSVIALAVMALVSVVLGRLVAARVLRPLRTMTAATRRISADNLHERLAVPGPADEVKDLADTIDELLQRLENSFAAQRRFVANASHELRTPLATIRASLDVAVAKPEPVPAQTLSLADRLRTELDQVDKLLDGFLVLARTQHGAAAFADRATLSLGGIAAEAVAARAADITASGLILHDAIGPGGPGGPAGARVLGSGTLLRRMVDNVIDNAIRHNHDGGWIRVATEDAGARLVVETGGRVLDPGQVAQLTEPFRRLGADRTGSAGGAGLGLSIVAAIATAHGGALDLRARAEGGLRVEITLPRAETGVPA